MRDATTPFATVDDLQDGWRQLDDAEQRRASKLIEYASDLIRTYPGWRSASTLTLERICCSVVRRAMEADMNGTPAGANSMTETAGPFSNTFGFANPSGDLRLWPSEEAQLKGRKARAASFDMATGLLTDHHTGEAP